MNKWVTWGFTDHSWKSIMSTSTSLKLNLEMLQKLSQMTWLVVVRTHQFGSKIPRKESERTITFVLRPPFPPASAIPAIWTPILGCPLRPPKSYLSVLISPPDLKNLTYSDIGPWCVLRRESLGMIHNSYGINPSNPQQPIHSLRLAPVSDIFCNHSSPVDGCR